MDYKTFSIRIDEELFDSINVIAEVEERNRNQQIIYFLKKAVAEYSNKNTTYQTKRALNAHKPQKEDAG
jgi:hypothetical protein